MNKPGERIRDLSFTDEYISGATCKDHVNSVPVLPMTAGAGAGRGSWGTTAGSGGTCVMGVLAGTDLLVETDRVFVLAIVMLRFLDRAVTS